MKNKPIRVTIQDAEQTISFLTEEETLFRLVAGCSISPANLGELLVAADIYQRGIAASVMAGLMEFDKALARVGPHFIHAAIEQARSNRQALKSTFQVIDEITMDEALASRGCKLVIIDLTRRAIRASRGMKIPVSGQVYIQAGEEKTNRIVTYILPKDWSVQKL